MTTTKQTWMKQAQVAKLEFAEETQHKRIRFAAVAIGMGVIGMAFVAVALAYPYFTSF